MEELPTNLRPELLLNHVAWLRRLAGTLVVDAARADDVAQATLLQALERPPARVDHPRAWLATAARNLARSFGRGERRREANERSAAVDLRQPAADEVVARTELHHEIVGAVLALAEPYRTAVLLRFFEDLKPGAIARRANVPVETIRTRLKRGIELLRAELIQRRAKAAGGRDAAPRLERPGEWAVALVGLLDVGLRRTVRRALLAKAAGAGAGAGVVGTSTLTGVLGSLAMATKWKVVAAILLLAVGAFVAVELRGSRRLPPRGRNESGASDAAVQTAARSAGEAPIPAPERNRVESPSAAAVIRARVVDEAGRPIEGARVGVLERADEGVASHENPPIRVVAGSESTTNAEGECDVPLPQEDAKRIVDLVALADGWNAGLWRRARAGESVFITLTRASELSGIVRDLAGAPVAGATIHWFVHGPRRFEGSATSGGDGRFRLATYPGRILHFGPDEYQPTWFEVTADGFAPLHFWGVDNVCDEGDGTWRLDLWLVRGATIRGRVVDLVTGAPIADADVWIEPWDPRVGRFLARTKSNRDGSFVLEHVPAWGVDSVGMYMASASSRHLGRLCAMSADRGFDGRSLEVPDDGAELSFELKLPQLGSVRGRVVDAAGAPIAGALVFAAGLAADSSWHRFDLSERKVEPTVTDADGRYQIDGLGLSEGTATKAPINARVESVRAQGTNEAQTVVTLVAGQVVTVDDLVLQPIAGLAVHVVDEAGRDVAEATVEKLVGTEAGLSDDDAAYNLKSGPDGRVFVPLRVALPSPRRAFLSIAAVGFASTRHDLEAETGEVTVALAPEHRLRGVVRDADGRLGGAEIVVVPAVESPEDLAEDLRTGEAWKTRPWSSIPHASVPIGKGRFLVRGLGPGPWHVAATGKKRDGSYDVAVAADVADETKEVEIVLAGSAEMNASTDTPRPSESECGRVELTLTFADTGKPVLRGGDCTLWSGGRWLQSAAIAPGRYRFDRVTPGAWQLVAAVPGTAKETRPLVVAAGQTTSVAVAISRGLVARGRLRLADLPSIRSGFVLFDSDDGGGGARGEFGADGSFELSGFVSGKSYRLWVSAGEQDGMPGMWVADEPARPAAEIADWSPHLVPAGVLVARFEDERSIPEGTAIRVFDHDGQLVYTRSPAHFGIERVLPVGDYVVKVDVPGLATQEQPVTVRQYDRATELRFAVR